jgi:hypothetical protein
MAAFTDHFDYPDLDALYAVWPNRWGGAPGDWELGSHLGDAYVQVLNVGSAARALIYEPTKDFPNQTIRARTYVTISGGGPGIGIRMSRDGTNYYGYILEIYWSMLAANSARLIEMNGAPGHFTVLESIPFVWSDGTYVWQELIAEDGRIEARIWNDGAERPVEPSAVITNAQISTGGVALVNLVGDGGDGERRAAHRGPPRALLGQRGPRQHPGRRGSHPLEPEHLRGVLSGRGTGPRGAVPLPGVPAAR